MTKRIGSRRRKTKQFMTKPRSVKGRYPIQGMIQAFAPGEKVVLKAEPSIHKGLYFRRFHGRIGEIIGKNGKCYEVSLSEGSKQKKLIINPVHLVRHKNAAGNNI
ncbi:50S ribosomal protein L21e [Candidatus Woesearchaeota archaeon]|nr:50S ribosomal protein L21e [Candidatus Woesearchaeota archaeon]